MSGHDTIAKLVTFGMAIRAKTGGSCKAVSWEQAQGAVIRDAAATRRNRHERDWASLGAGEWAYGIADQQAWPSEMPDTLGTGSSDGLTFAAGNAAAGPVLPTLPSVCGCPEGERRWGRRR